jgi:hypothetical protein
MYYNVHQPIEINKKWAFRNRKIITDNAVRYNTPTIHVSKTTIYFLHHIFHAHGQVGHYPCYRGFCWGFNNQTSTIGSSHNRFGAFVTTKQIKQSTTVKQTERERWTETETRERTYRLCPWTMWRFFGPSFSGSRNSAKSKLRFFGLKENAEANVDTTPEQQRK